MMRRTVEKKRLLACIAAFVFAACAQKPQVDNSATIQGVVKDKVSGAALEGVSISSTPNTETVTTGADGAFTLAKNVTIHTTYQLTAALTNYQTATATVTTNGTVENRVTTVEIDMAVARACVAGAQRCAIDGTEATEVCDAMGANWMHTPCAMGQICDPANAPMSVRCATPVDLIVMKTGRGTGDVRSTPGGIDCGMTCRKSFPQGAKVTLDAAAYALSTFNQWGGDCSGTSPTCVLTMDRPHTATADYTATGYLLTVVKSGPGTIVSNPAGISCDPTCTMAQGGFPLGSTVQLTASTMPPNVFGAWEAGACQSAGTNPMCTIVMNDNEKAIAFFTAPQIALTVHKTGSGAGTVTSDPAKLNCGATCAVDFDQGTHVTLHAEPGRGSTFMGWSGDCGGTNDCPLIMATAHDVTANFFGISHPVTVTTTGNGTVTSTPAGILCNPTCMSNFGDGEMLALTAHPGAGAAFTGWGGDCMASGSNPVCMITVDAAKTVSAMFAVGSFQISVAVSGGGTITSNPAGINCGTTCTASFMGNQLVTLTEAPTGSNVFAGWSGACTGATTTCMVTVTGAVSVNASFDPFYLHPLPTDGNCTTLLHFDTPSPLAQACGGGAAATQIGTWTSVPSRTSYLLQAAHSADAVESVYVDTMKPGPQPPSATVEMTINKGGLAFNGRGYAVVYGDQDALDPGTHGMRLIVYDDGRLRADSRDNLGNTTSVTSATGAIADNQWYQVAATLNATNIVLFIDGANVKTSTGTLYWTASSSTGVAGAEHNGAGAAIYRFNGAFDELRVSNVVRY
jgi:hypothetical protein